MEHERNHRRPPRWWSTVALGAVVALAAAGCSEPWDRSAPIIGPPPGSSQEVSALRHAEDCDAVVVNARESLERSVDSMWWPAESPEAGAAWEDQPTLAAPEDAAGSAGSAEGFDASRASKDSRSDEQVIGTNTQEADVDEADIVKTDGRRIVTLTGGTLRVVSLDGSPQVNGVLDLGEQAPSELFLRGDEAVVIGSTGGEAGIALPSHPAAATWDPVPRPLPEPMPKPGTFPTSTTITLVELGDASSPTITDTATIEGSYVSARMVDDQVSLVVRNAPAAMTRMMTSPDEASARQVVDSLEADELLPRIEADGKVGALGGCGDVVLARSEPSDDSPQFTPAPALDNITTVSIGETLDELHPVTIQGHADTIYASTAALYVAAGRWDGDGSRTDIHRFALSGAGPAAYTGSGSAPGRLLNQFALSERAGALRVVTTVDSAPRVAPADNNREIAIAPAFGTEARLTVLDTGGAALTEIAHLDGLGVGEEVKSVRFVGDLGYVVTFRTTDPLYALDLSDPRAPRVLGELEIPGFSEYLHPIGDGLLLGVGRQADPRTGMETGFKISLFDISDPAAMQEVDQIVIEGAFSPVGADHKAFLWDPARRQSVVPVQGDVGASALVVRVSGGRLERVADLQHGEAGHGNGPVRAFVVDEDLWTLSPLGLGRTSADAPGAVDLIRF